MEITFDHEQYGTQRFVNVTVLILRERVFVLYRPDVLRWFVYPISKVRNLEIEDGVTEDGINWYPESEK